MNQALKRGEYFWVDIARDGIVLYELPCHPLAIPVPLTPADAYQMARLLRGVAELQQTKAELRAGLANAEKLAERTKSLLMGASRTT